MKTINSKVYIGIVLFLMCSCSSYPAADSAKPITPLQPDLTDARLSPTKTLPISTKSIATSTRFQPSSTSTRTASTLPTASADIPKPDPFPLSKPGDLKTGRLEFAFKDPDRDNREVSIFIWYPAVIPEGQGEGVVKGAPPDLDQAPYPLILTSAKNGGYFAPHLVSFGFVVAGIRNLDTYEPWDQNLVDQPRDYLFVLNQIGSSAPAGLEGMIDADRSGVMGYSFDGYNSLALSGARIDPGFYFEQCKNASLSQPPLSDWRIWYFCDLASHWDEFVVHAGDYVPDNGGELWEPLTDKRIQAVMPMAPEGRWLFGERGLAAVDRPTLIIGGTEDAGDHNCPYDTEAAYIFEHLGTPDKTLVSFVGEGHSMINKPDPLARMKHLAAAFFGYHLQGRAEYGSYLSEETINHTEGLYWGVYKDE